MKKRSFVRGILFALISHYLVLFGMFLLYWLLRPFMWAAIYGAPYQHVTGAMDPNSGEWLIWQAVNFLSWIAGGYVACRWDNKNSNRVVLMVGAIYTVLTFIEGVPVSMGTARKLLFFLEIPIAISLGWCVNRYFDMKRGYMEKGESQETECTTT